jgi:hypothetical protein
MFKKTRIASLIETAAIVAAVIALAGIGFFLLQFGYLKP